MQNSIIFVVLLSAAAGTRLFNEPSNDDIANLRDEIKNDLTTISIAEPSSSSGSTLASSLSASTSGISTSSTETNSHVTIKDEISTPSLVEISESPISIPQTISEESDPLKRRIITYDQRQEGQYNIRADLENFMIVLIPPNPSEGLNLLDLLTKSAFRRNSHASKSKRKHSSPSSSSLTSSSPSSLFQQFAQSGKYRNSLKSGLGHNFNYVARPSLASNVPFTSAKHGPIAIVEGASSGHVPHRSNDFIEGRTPYHVDISASDDEQSRLHPDRQVDVLPPPYPLAYQHLIKPYHLEAEPTVIQALPPSELHATHVPGNFLESYNQLLTSGLQSAAAAESNSRARHNNDDSDIGYYRVSRAIRSGNTLDLDPSPRYTELPYYRGEHSLGAASFYPPIDVPKFSYHTTYGSNTRHETNADSQDTIGVRDQVLDDDDDDDDDGNIGSIIVPSLDRTLPQDDIELELHGLGLLDRDAKTLLSDSMERCAPGQRRDSYGMCREIDGY